MGILLAYAVALTCWLIPPFLISRSPSISRWRKTGWVVGCVLAALSPALLLFVGVLFAEQFAGYRRDAKAILFGPEATATALANITSLVLPWIVYFAFRKRHARSDGPSARPNLNPLQVELSRARNTVLSFVIVSSIAIVLLLSVGIPGYKQWRADKLVDRLCAVDGGLHINERVETSTQVLSARQSRIRFDNYKRPGDEFYFVSSSKDILGKSGGDPSALAVWRLQIDLHRAEDKKILGSTVKYLRRGGDSPLWLAHSSSYGCPKNASEWDLARQVVREKS